MSSTVFILILMLMVGLSVECCKEDRNDKILEATLNLNKMDREEDRKKYNRIIARLIKTANVTVEQRKSEFVTTENERHEVKAWCVVVNGMSYKSCNTQEEAEKAKEQFIKDYVEAGVITCGRYECGEKEIARKRALQLIDVASFIKNEDLREEEKRNVDKSL